MEKIPKKINDNEEEDIQDEDMISIIQPDLVNTIESFFTGDNLDFKTNIPDPINMTRLEVISLVVEKKGSPLGKEFIDYFVERFKTNMIAKDGNARKEVLQAITTKEQKLTKNKLMMDLKEEDKK